MNSERRGFLLPTLATLVAGLVTGCATYKVNATPDATVPSSSSVALPQTFGVLVSCSGLFDNKPDDALCSDLADDRRSTASGFQDSGVFSVIQPGPMPTDVRAEVRLVHSIVSADDMAFALLCGFTLGLVPVTQTSSWTMSTTFLDRKGAVIAGTTMQGKTVTYYSWLSILGAPFATPHRAREHLLHEMARQSLALVAGKGVFAGHLTASPTGEPSPSHP